MLISLKLTPPIPVKVEPTDEAPVSEENTIIPTWSDDDFDFCAGCKIPFKGAKLCEPPNDADGTEGSNSYGESSTHSRRGQQDTIEALGEKKVNSFYSFNVISGELLHVTSLQSIISVFNLRMTKSAPGLNLQDVNENLGFCQNCGTLISQLYKLHQEVTGLVQNGSVVSKLLEYEDNLTDNQETDFSNPKKRRKTTKPSNKINGLDTTADMELDGNSSWNGDADEQHDPSWSNDDYDMGNEDDPYENGNQDDESEKNVKPLAPPRTVGIKITSVASAKAVVVDQNDSDGGNRRRRSSARPVDYKKVLEGQHIEGIDDDDDDDEWNGDSRKSSKTTARKKTGGHAAQAPSRKGRGRPSKAATSRAKVVVPPSSPRHKDPAFKSPADKAREATCTICHKLYPASYLAEHMTVSHNAVSGQPCLICGKIFENSYKAIKHLLTHVPEKAFGCSRCHDTFKTSEERNQHTSSHLDSDKKLECPKCTNSFTSLLLLNKHEAQKHRTSKSFLCSICAKLLTGKDEWIQHILSHGPFQCYYCKVFLRPGEYKRHVQTVHITRPKLTASSSGPIAEVTLD